MASFFSFLFFMLLAVIVGGLLWWCVDLLGLPQPFNKVAKVILILMIIVLLLWMASSYLPMPWPHRVN